MTQQVSKPTEQRQRKPQFRRDDPTYSRELVLAWCLWLLGSWALTLGVDSSSPAVRRMIYSCMIGMMVLWPTWRLSLDSLRCRSRPGHDPDAEKSLNEPLESPFFGPAMVFRDWLSLNLVFQAVVWPLRISSHWSMGQTIWLDAAFACWSLLIAALVAWGCRSRHGGGRTVATLLCVLVILGEPLVMGLVNLGTGSGMSSGIVWAMRVSPVHALWVLAGTPQGWTVQPWAMQVVLVGLAAAMGWLIVLRRPYVG